MSLSGCAEAFKAVAGSWKLLTEEVLRLDPCLTAGAKSRAAVIGVVRFAVSCLARSMSLRDGSLFLRPNPPGVAVLAEDGSRTFLALCCCQGSAPPGDSADCAIGVTPGGFISDSAGAPLAPKVVISFREAFFAVSLPDPDREGGEIGGLDIAPALKGAVRRSC